MTNSFFGDRLKNMTLQFITNAVFSSRKPAGRPLKRTNPDRIGVNIVENQVKDLLQKANQKLILMVRQ